TPHCCLWSICWWISPTRGWIPVSSSAERGRTDMSLPAEAFEPAPRRDADAEAIARPSLSYWQDAWLRLRKNWLAMTGLIILILLTVMAIFGPYMVEYTYYEQNLETGKNLEPSAE